jgi:photosystem II stability/assembly factor-like uncharacterized protein
MAIKNYSVMTGLFGILLSSVVFSTNTAGGAIEIKTHFNHSSAISCDSRAQRCLATSLVRNANGHEKDYAVRVTHDGGKTWDPPVILQRLFKTVDDRDQMKIHCDSEGGVCLIVVTMHHFENPWPERAHVASYMTRDAGMHWSGPTLLPAVLETMVDLSCNQSGDHCLVLGSYDRGESHVYMTQNGGFTWGGPIPLPQSNEPDMEYDGVFSMGCSDSALTCTVIGGSNHPFTSITKDGGLTWHGPFIMKEEINEIPGIVGDDFFSNLHCNDDGLRCIALRHQSIYQDHGVLITAVYSYTTTDGGVHWQKQGVINNRDGEIYEPFHLFDCDKNGISCVAIHSPRGVVDANPIAYVTADGGQTWSKKSLKASQKSTTTTLFDIFCDDEGVLCQVVGTQDLHQ